MEKFGVVLVVFWSILSLRSNDHFSRWTWVRLFYWS